MRPDTSASSGGQAALSHRLDIFLGLDEAGKGSQEAVEEIQALLGEEDGHGQTDDSEAIYK
jgi:hypothetical protein